MNCASCGGVDGHAYGCTFVGGVTNLAVRGLGVHEKLDAILEAVRALKPFRPPICEDCVELDAANINANAEVERLRGQVDDFEKQTQDAVDECNKLKDQEARTAALCAEMQQTAELDFAAHVAIVEGLKAKLQRFLDREEKVLKMTEAVQHVGFHDGDDCEDCAALEQMAAAVRDFKLEGP